MLTVEETLICLVAISHKLYEDILNLRKNTLVFMITSRAIYASAVTYPFVDLLINMLFSCYVLQI